MMLQLWSSYSVGQEVYNPEQNQYESVDDRLNVQLRRARLGFKAEPYEGLQFTIAGAYDLIGRDVLDLSTVDVVVLDEADEMLNMGFQEDLTEILEKTPEDKRTWLFSATMSSDVPPR